MIQLTEALRLSIRFETNYPQYLEALMVINNPRFRGLGERRCRAFIGHASDVGDRMELQTIQEVSYLMFLMHWLGSFFYTDPRFAPITSAMVGQKDEEERLETARAAFMALAARHIGEHGEIVMRRLEELPKLEPLLTDANTPHTRLHDGLLDLWQITGSEREAYPRAFIEQQAVLSARALGADTETGRRLCLVLTHVLGVRFHEDPLYPWVAEKCEAARENGDDPVQSLMAYSRKRMAAMLRGSEQEG